MKPSQIYSRIPLANARQESIVFRPALSNEKESILRISPAYIPVINLLIEVLKPESILSLNTLKHNGESQEALSLIIIVSDSSIAFSSYEHLVEFATSACPYLSCSLYSRVRFLEGIKQGRLFHCIACQPSNLIYSRGTFEVPALPAATLIAEQEHAHAIFKQRFHTAKVFLKAAKFEFWNQEYSMASFMLHQAVELTFRALLESVMGKDLRIHSLLILGKFVAKTVPSISAFLSDKDSHGQNLLEILDGAYIKARYKDDFIISKKLVANLFSLCKNIQHLVEQDFSQLIKKIDIGE